MPAPARVDMLRYEAEWWARGADNVAGVDEVGRGPIAGPVVAAAVILPHDAELPGLRDSKVLSPARREELTEIIRRLALAVGVGVVDNVQIDHSNILRATMRAMRQALDDLAAPPDAVLVDGPHAPEMPWPHQCIISGDAKSRAIAAASVIAKTYRDAMMRDLDAEFPGYGFARHKGYGTAEHIAALDEHGPCRVHRRSFAPLRERQLDFFEA